MLPISEATLSELSWVRSKSYQEVSLSESVQIPIEGFGKFGNTFSSNSYSNLEIAVPDLFLFSLVCEESDILTGEVNGDTIFLLPDEVEPPVVQSEEFV